jgi:UDP-N-acetylmuramate dehydrogenase
MNLPGLKENEPLAPHVAYRIGGPARYWFEAKTSDELAAAVLAAEAERVPWVVLGAGSNVLVSDDGFKGLVILAANRDFRIEGNRVVACAGAVVSLLVRKTAEAGYCGFEWAASLPGTLGGAVRGNAGCYGGSMSDLVESVEVLRDGERLVLVKDDCLFSYRDSVFKRNRDVILSVTLWFMPSTREDCLARLDAFLSKRQVQQPHDFRSAGCWFKNFAFKDVVEVEKLARQVKIPDEFLKAKRIPAGWLVEQADFKGRKIGGAQVSPKHANFLVNAGGATASDILQLASMIKMRLRDDFGIQLEEEVQLVGF